jgi:hypothetical protein
MIAAERRTRNRGVGPLDATGTPATEFDDLLDMTQAGLRVTGTAPRGKGLLNGPAWDSITELAASTAGNSVPFIWCCLAAQRPSVKRVSIAQPHEGGASLIQ